MCDVAGVTEIVDRAKFLAVDGHPRAAKILVNRQLENWGDDGKARLLVVRGGLQSQEGKLKDAGRTLSDARPSIRSELGAAEHLGLKVTVLRDSGLVEKSLRAARGGVVAADSNEAWHVAAYTCALAEGAVGNRQRSIRYWLDASGSERALYKIGAVVNCARLFIDDNSLESASSLLGRVEGVEALPKLWRLGYHETRGRLMFALGDSAAAISSQRLAVGLGQELGPLRTARATLVLARYLLNDGRTKEVLELLLAIDQLVFALDDERHALAAAALLEVRKLAAANAVTEAALRAASRDVIRSGQGIRNLASSRRQS